MYYSLIVFCLFNLSIAAVIPEEKDARILSYEYKHFETGNYAFSYVTSNGITRNETGQLVNVGQDNEHIVVQGSYSYTDPNGESRLFQYTADENGYHVHLEHSLIRVDEEFGQLPAVPAVAPQLASLLGR